MRLTSEQKRDLETILPRAKDYIKRFSYKSYPKIASDLREISREVPSLQKFRWSKERISKLKKECGIGTKRLSIVDEARDKKLLKWICDRLKWKINNKVTTAMVKSKWQTIWFGSKKPSKSNLSRYRGRYGLTTIKNSPTGQKDVWILKQAESF